MPKHVVCMLGVSHDVSFGEIIFFATGVREIPPRGFWPKPSLDFLHKGDAEGVSSTFPKANTCTCCLMLPVGHMSYALFEDAIIFGIRNAHGFGYA